MGVLDSAVKVLRVLAKNPRQLGLIEIATELGMPKSSASRLLGGMCRAGLLERDAATKRFRVGLSVIEAAANPYRPGESLGHVVQDLVTALVRETGYTGYISLLDVTDTVVLQRFTGTHALQVLAPVASRRPAFQTSMGHALLSRLSDAEFMRRFGAKPDAPLIGAATKGPHTVGDLLHRVHCARADRSAFSINEGIPGIGAVATSLSDPATGEIVGLCLSFPAQAMSREQARRLCGLLVTKVAPLGRRLGDPVWAEARNSRGG